MDINRVRGSGSLVGYLHCHFLVEIQLAIAVAGQTELGKRVVQEINRRNPELYFLAFRNLEVLEEREIAVKVCRTSDIRPNQCTLLTIRRRSKAVRVKVQTRSVVP